LERISDASALAALQTGNDAAFDALFRAYYAPLCYYAASFTDGDMDDAEDVVQQTFVKLWEQRANLSITWSVKAYLYKTVHNTCLNRLRALKTREQYKQRNMLELEREHAPSPYAETELRERLQKALAELPTQCRQIFELSRFEELKYREIAEHLNISIKTVETQMGKALRIMRTHLADYLAFWIVWGGVFEGLGGLGGLMV
jgi:RNA polymerase sigma-70 factor, ECF subfamily